MMDKFEDSTLLDFETALTELESIVGKLENGMLSLEESLQLYKRGEQQSSLDD